MEQLPFYISLVFMLTTIATVGVFYKATNHSKTVLLLLTVWLVLQAIAAHSHFYTNTTGLPPRFVLLVLPPLLFIAGLFATPTGRKFLDNFDLKMLHLLHVIRIPVELVLFWLFVHKAVPQLMTFEGWNFDMLSGLTAPLIFYFGFVKKTLSRNVLLLWNFVCLGLLINIVCIAILSAPFAFQTLAFDQPNIAVLYFPFVWLPCGVVPLVLLSHLASIQQLMLKKLKASNAAKPEQTIDAATSLH